MNNSPDVLVTGGSIAGCIAALCFAQQGLSVTVIEKKRAADSYKRLCTHFIQPSALPVLKRLGLDKRIEAAGGMRNKADIWTSAGWIRSGNAYTGNPDMPHGYNIERRILDPLLKQMLAENPLIRFCAGYELCGVDEEVSNTVYVSNTAGKRLRINPRLIVAADGRYSRMAELLSNTGETRPNLRFACFAYFDNLPLQSGNHSQFWMMGRNMAFAYPLAGNRTLICLFIVSSDWPAWKNDLEKKLVHFTAALPDAPDMSKGRRVSAIYKTLDIPNLLRKPLWKGVAFVGDAAMALDPMSGVGCGFAIQTASWLADIAGPALSGNGDLQTALQRYSDAHQERLLPHAMGICADSLAEPQTQSRHEFFREIANDTALTDSFLALTGRIITPQKFQSEYLRRMMQRRQGQQSFAD